MLFFLDEHAPGQRVSITRPYSTADLPQHSQMKSDHARHTKPRRGFPAAMPEYEPDITRRSGAESSTASFYFSSAAADGDKALLRTIKSGFFVFFDGLRVFRQARFDLAQDKNGHTV